MSEGGVIELLWRTGGRMGGRGRGRGRGRKLTSVSPSTSSHTHLPVPRVGSALSGHWGWIG